MKHSIRFNTDNAIGIFILDAPRVQYFDIYDIFLLADDQLEGIEQKKRKINKGDVNGFFEIGKDFNVGGFVSHLTSQQKLRLMGKLDEPEYSEDGLGKFWYPYNGKVYVELDDAFDALLKNCVITDERNTLLVYKTISKLYK